jgi:chromosome segregation ATPase
VTYAWSNQKRTDVSSIDNFLAEQDYFLFYFDGLNNYYVAKEHQPLIKGLNFQPNVIDNYVTLREFNSTSLLQNFTTKIPKIEQVISSHKEELTLVKTEIEQCLAHNESKFNVLEKNDENLQMNLEAKFKALEEHNHHFQVKTVTIQETIGTLEASIDNQFSQLTNQLTDLIKEKVHANQQLVEVTQKNQANTILFDQYHHQISRLELALKENSDKLIRLELSNQLNEKLDKLTELLQRTKQRLDEVESQKIQLAHELQCNELENQRLHKVIDQANQWGKHAETIIENLSKSLKYAQTHWYKKIRITHFVLSQFRKTIKKILQLMLKLSIKTTRKFSPKLVEAIAKKIKSKNWYLRISTTKTINIQTPTSANHKAVNISDSEHISTNGNCIQSDLIKQVNKWTLGKRVDG